MAAILSWPQCVNKNWVLLYFMQHYLLKSWFRENFLVIAYFFGPSTVMPDHQSGPTVHQFTKYYFDNWTLVQVMARYRQATSHYLSQCWPRSMLPYDATWWRHQMETFSALLALCAGNSPVPVNSPHNGQWRGALMFALICIWINDWVNIREAGDLRRHRGHFDVNVITWPQWVNSSSPIAAYMRQWLGSALVQIMACRLFGAKPLSEPMLGYCQLEP